MSTQTYSVPVDVKDWTGRKVRSHTFHVSNDHRVDSHTFSGLPDGEYFIEYKLPPGTKLTLNAASTLRVVGGEASLAISLDELSNSNTSRSQESSSSSQKSSSNGSPALLLGASVASLLLLGNLKLPIDFFSNLFPPRTPQSQQGVRVSEEPGGTDSTGQSEATSLSVLDDKLRKCLMTNIRDVSGIPTLSGLAKKITLVTVTDEEIRTEANLLYDKVDRLRKILQGCDPKLASDLIAARSREANSTQSPYFTVEASEDLSQSYPITISHCNGRLGSANFRSSPTLAEWAILGHVKQGQKAYLTGGTEAADGEVWHEAIAPIVVVAPGKQVMPNQPGWIAGCFVR